MGVGCSKNPVNQATAKATLTQMINIVLRRMESDVEVIGHRHPTCQSICLFSLSGRFLLLEHLRGGVLLEALVLFLEAEDLTYFHVIFKFPTCCIIILIVVSHPRIEIICPCSKFR